MNTIKKEYILEGLCCGNCAVKIEKDVKALDGVSNTSVNAKTTILSVEYDSSVDVNVLINQVSSIVQTHDEDIIIKEKIS